jgi:alpha-D-ribose 1-methylphosphonate 5-triphosphate synthase subunit PhnG
MDATLPASTAARQHWMAVLAKATPTEILNAWDEMTGKPDYNFIRPPETGLVMVQARAGSSGQRFNFGEMTMTKCIVELEDGTAGHAYVAGSDPAHAEIAAVFDAVLQTATGHREIMEKVVSPLRLNQVDRKRNVETKTAATRVDFFTLVRGEDE